MFDVVLNKPLCWYMLSGLKGVFLIKSFNFEAIYLFYIYIYIYIDISIYLSVCLSVLYILLDIDKGVRR